MGLIKHIRGFFESVKKPVRRLGRNRTMEAKEQLAEEEFIGYETFVVVSQPEQEKKRKQVRKQRG